MGLILRRIQCWTKLVQLSFIAHLNQKLRHFLDIANSKIWRCFFRNLKKKISLYENCQRSLKLLSYSIWALLDHLRKKWAQKMQYRKPYVEEQVLLQNQGFGGRYSCFPKLFLPLTSFYRHIYWSIFLETIKRSKMRPSRLLYLNWF